VLVGSKEDRILANKHDRLSTYALLKDSTRTAVRDWIEQLADQGCIERVGEYGVLKLTERGRRILKGIEQPLLLEPAKKKSALKLFPVMADTERFDHELFEELRRLRRILARERGVPAYIIFSDATLRDIAAKCPSAPDALLDVSGIGMKKLEQYGERILKTIQRYEVSRKRSSGHT
jgi:ATP-dependent DNA helicase RecQ